jgi:hypothetical protein
LSRSYRARFSLVHTGGSSLQQAASLESQLIAPTQHLFGRTLRDPETNENRGNDDTFEKVVIAQLENEGIQQCILPRIPVYEIKHVLVDCAKHTEMSLFLVAMFFAHDQVGK